MSGFFVFVGGKRRFRPFREVLLVFTPADYLALAHSETDGPALRELARCPYSFVWQAVAANPHTPPAVLLELSRTRDGVWNDNLLLCLLAEHPGADRVVLRSVLDAVAVKLDEGERPYAVR